MWHGPLRSLPLLDRVVFVVVGALVVIASVGSQPDASTGRTLDVVALVLFATGLACAAVGLRAPATGALATLVLVMVWYGVGYGSGLINLPFLIAFYLLGATGDRIRQILVGGLAVASSLVGMFASGNESTASTAAAVGWTMAAILFGEATYNRRALIGELAARAASAEAERDREAERRVAKERLAIARDAHDILGHTVSLMTVQAGVAQDALEHGRDGAKEALQTIRAAGRDALGEVHALVSVLRERSRSTETAPAPALDRLEELATTARASGVRVDLVTDVRSGTISELAELTAYRVIQEGLTNVVRHARASRATITVRRCDRDLVVRVHDDGTRNPAGTDDGGYGLRGMRERVESTEGTFAAGPAPDGGWLVEARIPVHEADLS